MVDIIPSGFDPQGRPRRVQGDDRLVTSNGTPFGGWQHIATVGDYSTVFSSLDMTNVMADPNVNFKLVGDSIKGSPISPIFPNPPILGNLRMQFYFDGSLDTSNNYKWAAFENSTIFAHLANAFSDNTNHIRLSVDRGGLLMQGGLDSGEFVLYLHRPTPTFNTGYPRLSFGSVQVDGDAGNWPVHSTPRGWFKNSSKNLTGVRVFINAGNIQGKLHLFALGF